MPAQPTATDRRALALVREAEAAGYRVRRVVIEGKRSVLNITLQARFGGLRQFPLLWQRPWR